MSNTIWHKYDIKDQPERGREVLVYSSKEKRHRVCYIDHEDWVHGFYGWIERWTYLDDLISQADKAERLQKAVDLAVDYLEQVATHAKSEEDNFAAQVIKRKIDEIKQLIKETTNDK